MRALFIALTLSALTLAAGSSKAEDITCVSTTFRLIGANDKVCISAFDDPKVPGVACHISQARTGGLKGTFGLAEDPSRFSISCRQVGPISVDLSKLPPDEKVLAPSHSVASTGTFASIGTSPSTVNARWQSRFPWWGTY